MLQKKPRRSDEAADAQPEALSAAIYRQIATFGSLLSRYSLKFDGHDTAMAIWADETLADVLQVVDLRAQALLADKTLTLFGRARAVLGMSASQRLLTDSPEVLALIAWRFGLTSDVQALLANTYVFGLREAIERLEPLAARSRIRAKEHYYRVGATDLSEWDSVRDVLLAQQQADLQFDVLNPSWCSGSRDSGSTRELTIMSLCTGSSLAALAKALALRVHLFDRAPEIADRLANRRVSQVRRAGGLRPHAWAAWHRLPAGLSRGTDAGFRAHGCMHLTAATRWQSGNLDTHRPIASCSGRI